MRLFPAAEAGAPVTRPWAGLACRWVGRFATMPLALTLGLLLGCGSGISGTGSGDSPVPDGGSLGSAAPVALCDGSALSQRLCPSSGASVPAAWVDVVTGGRVQLQVRGNDAALRDDCRGRRFDGTWSTLADGTRTFVGSTLDDGALVRPPARLDLVTLPDGSLSVTVTSEQGQVLLPATGLRAAAAQDPAPSACPVV